MSILAVFADNPLAFVCKNATQMRPRTYGSDGAGNPGARRHTASYPAAMATDDVRPRLRTALTAAMKTRDRDVAAALRTVLAALDNAEAVAAPEPPIGTDTLIAGSLAGLGAGDAPRRELTEADVAAIVDAEIADLRASADDYDRLGRHDRANGLRAGAEAVAAAVTPT